MKCNNCGKELKDSDKYCGYCGMPTRERPPKKKHKIWMILLILCVILAVIIGIVLFMNREKLDENSVAYPDGDIVYHPQKENIKWDKDECVLYYDNLITVYLWDDISKKEEKQLANKFDGTIVTRIKGDIPVIQIKVKNTNLSKINSYAEELMKSEDVMYASYDPPCGGVVEGENDWGGEENKGDEQNPSGNDWWAETVGAYTAWKYVDEHTKKLSDVKVAVMDTGVDINHEDISDVENPSKINFLKKYTGNTPSDHGTHVTGIIAASDNDVGIRGIADKANITVIDWTPVTNDENAKEYVSLLDSEERTKVVEAVIEEGNTIMNNSWGNLYYSLESYTKIQMGKKLDESYTNGLGDVEDWISSKIFELTGTYEAYEKYKENLCKRTAMEDMLQIIDLINHKNEKFIILQAAGNGYDNAAQKGIDSIYAGDFCGITEELFNELNPETREHLEKNGVTYESIKNHIMIVTGIQKPDKKGEYSLYKGFNYGENVDICAPGGGPSKKESDKIYSTVVDKKYGYKMGTSMATPIVSGAVALLWQIDPDLTAGEVKNILIETAGEAKPSSKNDTRESYPMLNVGNAVQKAATDKALRNSKWRIESNGTKVYSFQKNGTVFDVTKKEYGFSDETEAIGNYENRNGIIEFEIEGKKRQFQYGKMSSIKDSVLVSDGNNWFNEDLFEKYKNEDIFYESNPEDGQYPIIMMPFQDKVKTSDTKIKEKLTSAYWKYMGADSILEEFLEDGSVKQYAWDITDEGADIGQYKVSDDTLLFLQNDRLWRLKYVKTESVKDELKRIFGENLSWLPEYIFYETDNVLQYPFDSDIGSCPFYLLPEDTEQTDWKEAYRNVIKEKEEEYGPYELHSNSNIQYAGGLCYLELKDIDNDGIFELYMVHNANVMNEEVPGMLDEERSYEYEVWTYKKGKAVQLETGGLCYSNGGWPSVVWTEYHGKTYLISSDGLSYWLHGFKDDGSFGVVYTYECSSVDSEAETFINGKATELDQWSEEVNMLLKNGTSTSLYYTDGDHVYKQVEEVKKEVGL